MEGTNLQPALGVDDRAQMGKRALFWKNLAKSGVAPLCQTFAVRDFAHFPIEPLGGRAVDAKDTMRGAAGGGVRCGCGSRGARKGAPGMGTWASGQAAAATRVRGAAATAQHSIYSCGAEAPSE